jgi:hypothetical protein
MTTRRGPTQRGPFPWRIHPIWRGIGCILIVLVPSISLGLAQAVLPMLETPADDLLAKSITLPLIGEVHQLLGKIILAIFFAIVISLVLSLISSIVYTAFGGHRNEDVARFSRRDPYRYK